MFITYDWMLIFCWFFKIITWYPIRNTNDLTYRNKAFYHMENLTQLGIGFVDYETRTTWTEINKIKAF